MKRATEDDIVPEIPPILDSSWDDEEPWDQTPPPDHEEFELVSAAGRRAIGERWERRRRNRQLQLERDRAASTE